MKKLLMLLVWASALTSTYSFALPDRENLAVGQVIFFPDPAAASGRLNADAIASLAGESVTLFQTSDTHTTFFIEGKEAMSILLYGKAMNKTVNCFASPEYAGQFKCLGIGVSP